MHFRHLIKNKQNKEIVQIKVEEKKGIWKLNKNKISFDSKLSIIIVLFNFYLTA